MNLVRLGTTDIGIDLLAITSFIRSTVMIKSGIFYLYVQTKGGFDLRGGIYQTNYKVDSGG